MSVERRIQALEQAAYQQGFDALSRRMEERLKGRSDAEIKAIGSMLETYCTTGQAMPGLLEIMKELTE